MRIVSLVPPDCRLKGLTESFTLDLWRWLNGDLPDLATDLALDLLLHGMKLCFELNEDYRQNLLGFTARYVFRTQDGSIGRTADFVDGHMEMPRDGALAAPQVTVIFRDGDAFRRFLLRQSIVDALMENEVTVEGNMNYTFKFGFLVQDLQRRLLGAKGLEESGAA